MDNIPNWALVNWIQPDGLHPARVWVYFEPWLQTIAQSHEPNPGSIIIYEGNIADGENVTQGQHYNLINYAIWQWLTKDEGGPASRNEGYTYLNLLYEGNTYDDVVTLFEESTPGSDTDGYASDGEGKEPVELLNKLNIKF